ncbi:MAG: hypothetical protein AMS20_02725 [Gemmatimonas sp. SG8_28]|jgi:hypothetical protein|nr:MAG: hypothetical protein AMS20_02725 [Gemmatimonas sp. SG8_28]
MQYDRIAKPLQLATAIGGAFVVTFWVLYFTANDSLGLVEPSVARFEEAFLVADAVFAIVLFATAVSLRLRRSVGPFLLAIAGSMSLYLGLLDATFYARNGLLFPLTGTSAVELVIIGLCIGGGLYALRGAWAIWRVR